MHPVYQHLQHDSCFMLHSSTLIGNSAHAPDLQSRIIAPRRGDRAILSHHPRIASCRALARPSCRHIHADPFMPIQTNRPRHALRQYRGHRRFQRSRRLLNFSTPRAAAPGRDPNAARARRLQHAGQRHRDAARHAVFSPRSGVALSRGHVAFQSPGLAAARAASCDPAAARHGRSCTLMQSRGRARLASRRHAIARHTGSDAP